MPPHHHWALPPLPTDLDLMRGMVLVAIALGVAGMAAVQGSRIGAVALAGLGVVWLFVDRPVEGKVLLQLSHEHGVTTADLLSVLAWLVAAASWAWWAGRRRTRARRRASSAESRHA